MPTGTYISDNAVYKDFGIVKKGDTRQVVGYYDPETHADENHERRARTTGKSCTIYG
jgi:hypothetical protein